MIPGSTAATSQSRRRRLACAALLLTTLACAALLVWPPETTSFYPVCPVYRYLHVLCPGCGATRALAALLRGRLLDALHFNPLFVSILPFATGYAALCCQRAFAREIFRWPRIPVPATYALLVASILFAIVRNLASVHT